MGRASKQLLALALAASLALGIGACGGSDGSSSSTAGTTATSAQETTRTAPANPTTGNGGGGRSASDGGSKQPGQSSEEGSAPFRTPGGDNSIQNFGEEAGSAEVEAATAALGGYLDARAKGSWARSCTYLAKSAVAPLEQLAASSPKLKGKDCGAILASLEGEAPPSSRVSTLKGPVASLRSEGERGFALYHGPDGVDYFVPMVREGGSWKVGALAPSEFP